MADGTRSERSFIHPHPILPRINVGAGLLLLLVAALAIVVNWSSFWKMFEAAKAALSADGSPLVSFYRMLFGVTIRNQQDAATAIALMALPSVLLAFGLIVSAVLFRLFALGFSQVGKGLLQWSVSGTPEEVPGPYKNPNTIINSLREKKQYRAEFSEHSIAYFGHGIQYISPAAVVVAKPIIERLGGFVGELVRRLIGPFFVGMMILGIVVTAPGGSTVPALAPLADIVNRAGPDAAFWKLVPPLLLLIGVTLIGIVLDWLFVRALARGPRPPALTSTQTADAQVAMPPSQLSERFQQSLGCVDELPQAAV